ncbi:unnamed protein product [Cladocopium goreaui]|uniref:Uncharacterized protein n=1 Tax=Cladocopium goreaui TaxID=2562237 RepID=A0A9P1C773_9DINO|nr:unnamed protein product [Cladocopium goreaui]
MHQRIMMLKQPLMHQRMRNRLNQLSQRRCVAQGRRLQRKSSPVPGGRRRKHSAKLAFPFLMAISQPPRALQCRQTQPRRMHIASRSCPDLTSLYISFGLWQIKHITISSPTVLDWSLHSKEFIVYHD